VFSHFFWQQHLNSFRLYPVRHHGYPYPQGGSLCTGSKIRAWQNQFLIAGKVSAPEFFHQKLIAACFILTLSSYFLKKMIQCLSTPPPSFRPNCLWMFPLIQPLDVIQVSNGLFFMDTFSLFNSNKAMSSLRQLFADMVPVCNTCTSLHFTNPFNLTARLLLLFETTHELLELNMSLLEPPEPLKVD